MVHFIVFGVLKNCTSLPHFIVLHWCYIFYKLEARPSTRKKHHNLLFIMILSLLLWSGAKPELSPRHACRHKQWPMYRQIRTLVWMSSLPSFSGFPQTGAGLIKPYIRINLFNIHVSGINPRDSNSASQKQSPEMFTFKNFQYL